MEGEKTLRELKELKGQANIVATTAVLLGYTVKHYGDIVAIYSHREDKFPFLEIKIHKIQQHTIAKTKFKGEDTKQLITTSHDTKMNHITSLIQKL